MIVGRFHPATGRPLIKARLSFPKFQISRDVNFLVDTGADSSLLMPDDASRIGVPFTRLTRPASSLGLGGVSEGFLEDAVLAFNDQGVGIRLYTLQLLVISPARTAAALPSLLGRNVLDRWRLTYDPGASKLEAEVRTADATVRTAL